MTRPAVIIGLGGTGQWILTFLKKDLLEIGNGQLPKEVQLLCFDTTSQVTVEAGYSAKKNNEEAVRAGAVRLEDGTEFVPIGANVTDLAKGISRNEYPHLQWYPAGSYLAKLNPGAFNTREGSGQLRPMGRISLFQDVKAPTNSKVLSHLRRVFSNIKTHGMVSADRQLEIIIIGSLAGGTGAGLLVDIALLAREQAAKLGLKTAVVRGFFVLPRAFINGVGQGTDMYARAFAAWRELDRFMIVSDRFGIRQMVYNPNVADLQVTIDKRAYDVSYMVDTARNTENSLDNMPADRGVYPAVAQVISAILDGKAGAKYTEFVSTNLAGKLALLPVAPYHSAIGSYTLKVPVYYAKEKFSHQLALEVLKLFLQPRVNDKGWAVGVSELHNREVQAGMPGLNSVLDFLGMSALNIQGVDIPNTQFLPMVSEVRKAQAAGTVGNLITQVARGGLSSAQNRWLLALTNIGVDDAGKQLADEIKRYLNRPIWEDVRPSFEFHDSPLDAYTRIVNAVPRVRQEYYGIPDVEGQQQQRGRYGEALKKAQAAQVARFIMLLSAWTLKTLNGANPDPIVARGGKIGYVLAFYEELQKTLILFQEFLDKVRAERNETLKLSSKTEAAAERAKQEYYRLRGKRCWMTFYDGFVHPDAHRSQRNYLRAEQRSIDVRKDNILLDVISETTTEMLEYTQKTLQAFEYWITTLVTGDPALGITGMYQAISESLGNVNLNHQIDKASENVSAIIGQHEYQSDPKYVQDALDCLVWHVIPGSDRLEVQVGVEFPADQPNTPPTFRNFRHKEETANRDPKEYNLRIVLSLAERPYQVIQQERPIAREISGVFPTGKQLAESVGALGEPLYTTSGRGTATGPQVTACYIRVHAGMDETTIAYFNEFLEEMKARHPNIMNMELVDSEDKHKMTIVRSDDLLPSTEFDMWHLCKTAYIQMVTDPKLGMSAAELHIFPAEINACSYEAEMPKKLNQDFRTLQPEVVAVLENKEHFEMFFMAYALGFIRMKKDENLFPYWSYQLPGDEEELFITEPKKELGQVKEPDIFQVIHNFAIEGCDQRQGRGQNITVKWDDLKTAILKQEKELGREKAIEVYRAQLDNPDGLIQTIRRDVEVRRSAANDDSVRKLIGQEHTDLADLGKLIYLQIIDSVKARLQQ